MNFMRILFGMRLRHGGYQMCRVCMKTFYSRDYGDYEAARYTAENHECEPTWRGLFRWFVSWPVTWLTIGMWLGALIHDLTG